MAAPRNLVNLKDVEKGYRSRSVLRGVTLGVAAGDRIGVGGRADHEWRADPAFRGVLEGLLGGVELRRLRGGLDAPVDALSGGERRRGALARMLLRGPELLP